MKILVACEESQVVTKAFRAKGHEAYSCDIKDCSGDHAEWHIKDDVLKHLNCGWDMMIMFPPCIAMCVSGNGTYAKGKEKHFMRGEAVVWTKQLWDKATSLCRKVVMENPVSVLWSQAVLPKPQYIQPWMFGHMETKKTGLCLYGVPDLKETNNVKEQMDLLSKKDKHKTWYASPGKDRSKIRSKFLPGIAQAMADQWG